MKMLLSFKNPEDDSPTPDEIRNNLMDYHSALVSRLGPQPEEKGMYHSSVSVFFD